MQVRISRKATSVCQEPAGIVNLLKNHSGDWPKVFHPLTKLNLQEDDTESLVSVIESNNIYE